jgi:hypothetical protein
VEPHFRVYDVGDLRPSSMDIFTRNFQSTWAEILRPRSDGEEVAEEESGYLIGGRSEIDGEEVDEEMEKSLEHLRASTAPTISYRWRQERPTTCLNCQAQRIRQLLRGEAPSGKRARHGGLTRECCVREASTVHEASRSGHLEESDNGHLSTLPDSTTI